MHTVTSSRSSSEHHDRFRPKRAARREQRLGGTQVRPHAEVEVGFAFRADRRGKMKDHVGPGEHVTPGAGGIQQVAEVATDRSHSSIRGEIRSNRRTVNERHPG